MKNVRFISACFIALLAPPALSQSRPPIGVGDLSYEDGRPMRGHHPQGGHTDGSSMDVRPMRKDGQSIGVRWQDPEYDRESTQEVVDAFWENGGTTRIVFSDPAIKRVTHYKGLDDHMHITVDLNWKRK